MNCPRPRLATLKPRLILAALLFASLLAPLAFPQSEMPAADSSSLDFKQWGLLAIQDGGRRKPVDTFAREALMFKVVTFKDTFRSILSVSAFWSFSS